MIQNHEYIFDWDMFFRVASVVGPIVSGLIVGALTHLLALRSKKFDLLYQHKVNAFKELNEVLIELKRYFIAKEAEGTGNEFAPEAEGSMLEHREKLYNVTALHGIFLGDESKKALDSLQMQISHFLNLELYAAMGTNEDIANPKAYEGWADRVDNVIRVLYNDLNRVTLK